MIVVFRVISTHQRPSSHDARRAEQSLLASQRTEVSTLVVFVGAIGGVAVWGILGLVVGPVLLSFGVALVRFAADQDLPDEG